MVLGANVTMTITCWCPTPSYRKGCGKTLVRQMRPLRGVGAADELPPDCHALRNTNSAQLDHTILYRLSIHCNVAGGVREVEVWSGRKMKSKSVTGTVASNTLRLLPTNSHNYYRNLCVLELPTSIVR